MILADHGARLQRWGGAAAPLVVSRAVGGITRGWARCWHSRRPLARPNSAASAEHHRLDVPVARCVLLGAQRSPRQYEQHRPGVGGEPEDDSQCEAEAVPNSPMVNVAGSRLCSGPAKLRGERALRPNRSSVPWLVPSSIRPRPRFRAGGPWPKPTGHKCAVNDPWPVDLQPWSFI